MGAILSDKAKEIIKGAKVIRYRDDKKDIDLHILESEQGQEFDKDLKITPAAANALKDLVVIIRNGSDFMVIKFKDGIMKIKEYPRVQSTCLHYINSFMYSNSIRTFCVSKQEYTNLKNLHNCQLDLKCGSIIYEGVRTGIRYGLDNLDYRLLGK